MSDTYHPQKDSALSYEEAVKECRRRLEQGLPVKIDGKEVPPLTKPDDIERFGG